MKRVYKFSIVSYLTESEILTVLKRKSFDIRRYAYILHDEEETDLHYHILLYTYNSHTFSSVRKWFTLDERNTFTEEIKDDIRAFEYLTHKNDLDKYQYSESGIRYYNWNTDSIEYDNNGFEPLELMLKKVPLRMIAKKFGKDFIYHYNAYKALYDDIIYIDLQAEPFEQKTFID